MKITKPMRGNRGSKRLDLTDMREAFRDRRTWCSIGIVTDPRDGAHFEVVEDGHRDVVVEVVLQPSLMPVTCRLAAAVWIVPNIGDEVVVLIPEGDPAFMPCIIALLSSNSVPTTQGPALNTISIVRDQVLVHDGAGGAVALALKSDVDNLANHYDGHTHSGVTTGGGISGTIAPAQLPVPSAAGTTVLKAK